MKKSQLRKIIKEEISKVLSEDTNHINQSKLINIELLLKLFAGIDGFDDEDNEEILKALNYPSDYSNEYKAKILLII